MIVRAIYLVGVFLPFLVFGPLLLFLSSLILKMGTRRPPLRPLPPLYVNAATVAGPAAAHAAAATPGVSVGVALPPAPGGAGVLLGAAGAGDSLAFTYETRSNPTAAARRVRVRGGARAAAAAEEEEGIGERRAWSSVDEMMDKAPETLGMSGM